MHLLIKGLQITDVSNRFLIKTSKCMYRDFIINNVNNINAIKSINHRSHNSTIRHRLFITCHQTKIIYHLPNDKESQLTLIQIPKICTSSFICLVWFCNLSLLSCNTLETPWCTCFFRTRCTLSSRVYK